MSKKAWKDWALAYIKSTGQCPGDPSFGLPTDLLTKEEFELALKSQGTHKYKDCHFIEERLGIPVDTLHAVEFEDRPIDTSLQSEVSEVMKAKRLAKLKENLVLYVDRIHFKDNGVLSIPSPLLNLPDYIKKSL